MDFLTDEKEFELLMEEAGKLAREFNDMKLELKLLGFDVNSKSDEEIERLYRVYEATVLYQGC